MNSATDAQNVAPPAPSNPVPLPPAPPPQPAIEQFYASIFPGADKPLPDKCKPFAKAVLEYEKRVGHSVLVISQSDAGNADMDSISDELADAILNAKCQFEAGKRITVILHTLGGDPSASYKIGIFLQKLTGGFEVVIPRIAKSAGTLLTLGASKIIMAQMAEIGPLDMQVKDPESDLWDSALNETKALQTLSREALVLYSSKMELLGKMYASVVSLK